MIFKAANLAISFLASIVPDPTCGRTATFSIDNKGLSECIGSGFITSSPAPQILPELKASIKSVSYLLYQLTKRARVLFP